jgi:hypothetical protein
VKARQEAAAKARQEAAANRTVETCPQCGGSKRGKGYSHTDECPSKQKPSTTTETCPKCGGSKRGRGFSHADGCSEKQKAQAKAAKKRPRMTRTRRPRL